MDVITMSPLSADMASTLDKQDTVSPHISSLFFPFCTLNSLVFFLLLFLFWQVSVDSKKKVKKVKKVKKSHKEGKEKTLRTNEDGEESSKRNSDDSDDDPPESPLRASTSMSALPLLTDKEADQHLPKSLEKSTSLGRSLSILASDGLTGRASSASLTLSKSGSMRGAKIKQHSLFDFPQHMLPPVDTEENTEDSAAAKQRKKLTRDGSEGTLRKKKHGGSKTYGPPSLPKIEVSIC